MKNNKKINGKVLSFIVILQFCFVSCSDFFEPKSKNELSADVYISNMNEMYGGLMGVFNKMQEVGDKEIYLTDTRAELLEPSDKSNAELISIYNYEDNLEGNSYANPSGYYAVIIACNDYLKKMEEFKNTKPEEITNYLVYRQLYSTALRCKVWAYKTIAEIYGETVWFDDPIRKLEDLGDSAIFKVLDLDMTVDACLNLLENGYHGIPANLNVDWIAWLDPSNVTQEESSQYRMWNYMAPPFEGLLAELCLWKGAALDAQDLDATHYYQIAADTLLYALNQVISDQTTASSGYWIPNAQTPGQYDHFWSSSVPWAKECVAAIQYDYQYGQTNSIVKHFYKGVSAEYLLRPSIVGMARFYDNSFNPGASIDKRPGIIFKKNGEDYYLAKFKRTSLYQADVPVYIYRSTQYHIMLAEALNHLKRFVAADAVLNLGVNASFVAGKPEWKGFTADWTQNASWGARSYPHLGIRGAFNLSSRKFYTILDSETSLQTALRSNDMSILDEYLLEFCCEGKTYPAMIRFAKRYKDPEIISSRIIGKYELSKQSKIKNMINNGSYFVSYDLNL